MDAEKVFLNISKKFVCVRIRKVMKMGKIAFLLRH